MAGPADVVHDLVRGAPRRAPCGCGPPMSSSTSSQVTRSHLPAAARARALQRVEDALGVVDLVERRRALGAVAPAAARVGRVALELADLAASPCRRRPSRPQAASQLKQIVGIERVVALDLAAARPTGSYSPSRPSARPADRRPAPAGGISRAAGCSGSSDEGVIDSPTKAGWTGRPSPTDPPTATEPARARRAASPVSNMAVDRRRPRSG